MSYQVLARKWRPRTFSEMVGQEHVLRALINALDHGRLHHAFLFTGTRGVGKTTIARILAKSLNCETGVTSKPCGTCSACTEIDAGRFVDLIEVDAASRTKVDDTRELLDNVQYTPARGRYKVYLVDEVHMLSNHSFNALLKTLEEPPPHVKFLFATTDPQKLPVTILSRCLQFNLKRLPAALISAHLTHVLSQEGVMAEPAAVTLIARAADGSMRDALSLLDQAIAYGGGRLVESEVRAMLGTIERRHVYELLNALAAGDAETLMRVVDELDATAPDYAGVLEELAATLQRIAVLQAAPGGATQWDDRDVLADFASRLTPEDVQLFYQIAILGRRDLALAPDGRGGFEMTLLRMLAFQPDGRTNSSQPGLAQAAPASSAPASTRASTAARPAVPVAREPAAASEASKTAPAAVSPAWREPDWIAVVEALDLKGAARQLALNCAYQRREGNTLHFTLAPAHGQLATERTVAHLQEALSAFYREPLKVKIQTAGTVPETPAQRDARRQAQRLEEAREAIARDPNVQALQETFGARVEPDSIRPVD